MDSVEYKLIAIPNLIEILETLKSMGTDFVSDIGLMTAMQTYGDIFIKDPETKTFTLKSRNKFLHDSLGDSYIELPAEIARSKSSDMQ